MMLRHLGEVDASDRLQTAVESVYREGKCLTSDVGGTASTSQFTDAVCAVLKS
jgi:isocitrate dehydrogenase (NAD+)